MAYYLMYRKGNEYVPINIEELPDFEKLSKFKNGGYSLEEIDKLTSKSNDAVSFRIKLYAIGLISKKDITKDISIRCKHDGKFNRVAYDLIYAEEGVLLSTDVTKDSQNTIQEIPNNLMRALRKLSVDNRFLNKLCKSYNYNEANNYETVQVINNILLGNYNIYNIRRLSDFLYEYRLVPGVSRIVTYLDSYIDSGEIDYSYVLKGILTIFVYNELYSRRHFELGFQQSTRRQGDYYEYDTSEIKNYRKLHDLVMFISHYLNGDRKLSEDDKKELKSFIEEYKSITFDSYRYDEEEKVEKIIKPKVKSIKKVRTEVEGQLTLGDML